MPDVLSNSEKTRQAGGQSRSPRAKQVVSADEVITGNEPKSDLQEFVELFIPEDPNSVKRSIMERIADGIKSLLWDMFGAVLYPGSGPIGNQYNGYWKPPTTVGSSPSKIINMNQPSTPIVTDPRQSGVEVKVRSYPSALAVIKEVSDVKAHYPVVRVQDLKNAAGAPTVSTDSDYGWKDISKFRIVKNYDGTYSVVAPTPYELN